MFTYIYTHSVCVFVGVYVCVCVCVCEREPSCVWVYFWFLFVCLCICTVLTWCIEWDSIRKFHKTYPQPHNTSHDATQNQITHTHTQTSPGMMSRTLSGNTHESNASASLSGQQVCISVWEFACVCVCVREFVCVNVWKHSREQC